MRGNIFGTSAETEADLTDPDQSTLFSRSIGEIFGTDPQLKDNGGATDTVTLIAGSPAIDAVPPLDDAVGGAIAPAALVTDVDQRGVDRTELSDAGAFEFGAVEADGGDALAVTGAGPLVAVGGVAALLLALGAALLLAVRRRTV